MEECAEVALATEDDASKMQEEIGDLWCVIDQCVKNGIMTNSVFASYKADANGFGNDFEGLTLEDLGNKFLDHLLKMQIRASKAIRFGILEIEPRQSWTNAERLSHETAHFIDIVCFLVQQKKLDLSAIERQFYIKVAKLEKYMQS
jgi:phosphoribosyl-ATP pyrophosphohydrolase